MLRLRDEFCNADSLGAVATDGKAWILGLNPTGRLRTCQPMIWKTRCTVFLFMSNRWATVRYPKEGFSSIIALIGLTYWSCTLGSPLVGL